ncbi:EamA family transporter [Candidatus Woesearchaeota archaeon]|nr:EamA family transporter [Candidatus Woesearchaeota archaeon]
MNQLVLIRSWGCLLLLWVFRQLGLKEGRVFNLVNIFAVFLVLVASMIGSAGSLFLKLGADKLKPSISRIISNYSLIFGLFLYGVSTIFYVTSLKMDDLSIIYPITSLSYIWTAMLSMKFLKEEMNIFKWTGIFFIVIGIIFIVN